jgi:hypothetical protein
MPIPASATEAQFSAIAPVRSSTSRRCSADSGRFAQQQLAAERPVELQRPVGGAPDTGAQRRVATRSQRAANRATATLMNR